MTSILCLGNFGGRTDGQQQVAKLMIYLYKKYKYKFIIGLGNNILPEGVKSVNDKKFNENFEEPYKQLLKDLKFYNILGDVDYITRKSLNSQINYGTINKRWVLPNNFYCFKKVINKTTIEFIVIDTNLDKIKNKKTQEIWALNTLLESRSRWNILISHHPWYSRSNKNNCDSELDLLYTKLNNTNKLDLIVSGHDTSQQHIYIPNKPNMIISGVGCMSGKMPVLELYNELKFFSNELGCLMIEFNKNKLNISFYNANKIKIHNFSIVKY